MSALQRIIKYYAPHKRLLLIGVCCILLVNLTKLTAPIILRQAVDALALEVTQVKLWRFSALLIMIALMQGCFLFWQRRQFIKLSRYVDYNLRNDFYVHLQKLSFGFYQTHRTGDLVSRGINDLAVVRNAVLSVPMYAVNTLLIVALTLPQMIFISRGLTLLAFLSMPLVVIATQGFSKRIHHRSGEVQEYYGVVSNQAQESLSGIRIIRAYNREASEIEKFRQVNRNLVDYNLKLVRLTGVFIPTLQFLVELGFLAILWYGGRLAMNAEISIGQFVQFTLYLGYLVYPMIEMGSVISLFQRGKASMERIHEIMAVAPMPQRKSENPRITAIIGEIEFRHLNFTYPGASAATLKDINLHIRPGQTVALIGTVGSGKSTLINLIPRLLEAGPGHVLIDGHPIDEVPLSLLRTAIGYVPQESFLFSDTLANNIAFAVKHASLQDIEKVAMEVELAADIKAFPKGFQTVLGERGVTLSGGQKQRTAMARALMRRPKILILDDALSSVDTYTEEKILARLRERRFDCTTLIVSNRISTVKDADLIVMLANGRIVESGTHEQLILISGLYAQLYEKQLIEEELTGT